MNKNITHEGVVVKVEGHHVTVRFVQHSACSACHAKALCTGGSSESAERQVVANSYGVPYSVGQQVRVIVGSGLARSAVMIAFVVPIVVAFVALFGSVNMLGLGEVGACLATLGVLAVYYLGVWTQRDRLERRTEFTLEPLV